MRHYLTFIFLMLGLQLSIAQSDSSAISADSLKGTIIKLSPLSGFEFQGTFFLSLEQRVRPRSSFQVDAGVVFRNWFSPNPFADRLKLLDNEKLSYHIKGEFRFYSQPNLAGGYVAVQANLKQLFYAETQTVCHDWVTNPDLVNNPDVRPVFVCSDIENNRYTIRRSAFGVNFKYGKQEVLSKHLVINWYFAWGIRYVFSNVSGKLLGAYDPNLGSVDGDSYRSPFDDPDDFENRAENRTGLRPVMLGGIQIGYRL